VHALDGPDMHAAHARPHQLTRGASRTLRNILVRDPNGRVAISVLANNAVSEQEIEAVARNRSVVEDVLVYITGAGVGGQAGPSSAPWCRTPGRPSPWPCGSCPSSSVRDLRDISRDRNIPDAVRTLALRLYRIKRQ